MKRLLLVLILISLTIGSSCKSIQVDYFSFDKNLTSMDVYYIKDIEIHAAYSMTDIISSVNRLLLFALQKKQYTVKSYLTEPGIGDNYRYHILIKTYVHQTGTTIDKEESIIIFYVIYDTKLKKEIMSIRAACTGCDLRNVDDQINLFDTLVTKFDSVIKK